MTLCQFNCTIGYNLLKADKQFIIFLNENIKKNGNKFKQKVLYSYYSNCNITKRCTAWAFA